VSSLPAAGRFVRLSVIALLPQTRLPGRAGKTQRSHRPACRTGREPQSCVSLKNKKFQILYYLGTQFNNLIDT